MRTRRQENGAAAVELALVLPVLMVVLLGIIEFSYAFLMQASVSNAARVGVRDYAINYSSGTVTEQATIQQNAINLAKSTTPNPANVVSGSFSANCVSMGQTTLTLTYRYHSITGWFDGILGSWVTVKGIGSMQCGG